MLLYDDHTKKTFGKKGKNTVGKDIQTTNLS